MALPAGLPLPFHPYIPSEEATLVEALKTVEVPATMSASLREATPTTPDPASKYLRVSATVADQVRAFLDAERTAPIGVGAQILEAKLLLYKVGAWQAGTHTLTIQAIDASWDADTATWSNQPPVRAAAVTKVVNGGGADGDLIEIDITDLLAASVSADDAAGARWYGVRITKNTTGEDRFYAAAGPTPYRPKLRVKPNQPPDDPSDLIPAGDRIVSEVRPELVWRFHDPDASDALAFVQVQVSTVDDFSTTVYDSGKVARTTPRFDLASPPSGSAAVSDLSSAITYYWRAKHWDSHNLESDWSPAASFSIRLKGSLSLITPSGATVTSPTPAISWALTTTTQSAYEVVVDRKESGVWVEHYRVPWTLGSTTSIAVPDAYALREGEDYRVSVRVKDQYTREDMPGDRTFYEVTRDITLAALT